MILEQRRLDAIGKKRSNLFDWRGQFTPEFVEYILTEFVPEGGTVIDPFSGSGTVLQEAARLDLTAVGCEINPSAYFMSKFYEFCNMGLEKRHSFLINFKQKLSSWDGDPDQPVYIPDLKYRASFANLLEFANNCKAVFSTVEDEVFFLNLLFRSEKHKKLTIGNSIDKSFNYLQEALLNLPYTESPIRALMVDARSVANLYEDKADLILTSPPYINVFNYHQNYRAIIEEFSYDVLKVASSEFGSNRKNRGNRLLTVIQYCLDMERSIHQFWKSLKPEGKIVLVVGRESNVRGTPFLNGEMIIEILELSQGFQNIRISERSFTNKFGINIKEDIIIADKRTGTLGPEVARDIALNHLERALRTAESSVIADLRDAIGKISDVSHSPLFNQTEIK